MRRNNHSLLELGVSHQGYREEDILARLTGCNRAERRQDLRMTENWEEDQNNCRWKLCSRGIRQTNLAPWKQS